MILLGALLLANCSGDFEQETGIVPSHSGQVSFLFGLQQDDASVVQTRGSKPEQITRMWYAIANERGEIIKPLYQKLEENFSKLTIEGLSMGDYTVVFLATTSEEEDEAVKEPEKLSDDWLINHAYRQRSGFSVAYSGLGAFCRESGCRFECIVRLYVEIHS